MDDYSISLDEINALQNVGEFEVWLWMLDERIEFVSIDPLIEFLASKYHRPDFTIAAIKYKKENNL